MSLHLEGKLEPAVRLLSKAIEGGEKEPGLYTALGHIQYEMRDYDDAALTYMQLVELDPAPRGQVRVAGHEHDAPAARREVGEEPLAIDLRARPVLGQHDDRPDL